MSIKSLGKKAMTLSEAVPAMTKSLAELERTLYSVKKVMTTFVATKATTW